MRARRAFRGAIVRFTFCLFLLFSATAAAQQNPIQGKPSGDLPPDPRTQPPRTLNSFFPFDPPSTTEAWEKRRRLVREQVLVANGLWPLPPRTPLQPVIHGKIRRDGYTIEKVFFASLPGHYVTGNLYRPDIPGKAAAKRPAILTPHGHWANGRFFEGGEAVVAREMKNGAEKTPEGAKYPLQARCAQLARMGCVVFHYDMVGYADSTGIPHRSGFTDVEAALRLQNFMGLQTWNSLRALDFLAGLPDVDPQRIGVTGASGGGTQTFLLGAIDDRPAAAFPAVMVSTAMQGGCICENCSYLRIGTGNIELAALFAPRPLGLSAADDWTKEIETKGLPQLRELYKTLGAPERIEGKAFLKFGHNYNQVAREMMYGFFNRHLKLGHREPVVEKPFTPVPPKELSVFDDAHPRPKDAVGAEGVRRWFTEIADKDLAELKPSDGVSLARAQKVLGTALRVMTQAELPDDVVLFTAKGKTVDGHSYHDGTLVRRSTGERVRIRRFLGNPLPEAVVLWVHPEGLDSVLSQGDKLHPAAAKILNGKQGLVVVEVLNTGKDAKPRPPVDKRYPGYTFGYNRPLVAERVQDILTGAGWLKHQGVRKLSLAGFGKAGPWALLAAARAPVAFERVAADADGFRFEQVKGVDDPMMLPGALKYGGLANLASLIAPRDLLLHNAKGIGPTGFLQAAYGQTANLDLRQGRAEDAAVAGWLLR